MAGQTFHVADARGMVTEGKKLGVPESEGLQWAHTLFCANTARVNNVCRESGNKSKRQTEGKGEKREYSEQRLGKQRRQREHRFWEDMSYALREQTVTT